MILKISPTFNPEYKQITCTIDTKNNRYFFGVGLWLFFYTRVGKKKLNDYSCFEIGKEYY